MEMNTLSHGITFVESDVLLQDISNQHAGSTDYSDHCCIKCNTKTSEKEKSKHSYGYWELVRIEKEKKSYITSRAHIQSDVVGMV